MKKKIFSLAAAFGVPVPANLVVNGWEHDAQEPDVNLAYLRDHVPVINQDYRFRKDLLRDFNAWSQACTEPLFLYGPTGCGKSSFILQAAARLGIPVFCITGNSDTELVEIFGHYVLAENGQTVFRDGPATEAAKCGAWFLIDEVDRMSPATLVGLNGVLEGGSFTLTGKGGEIVIPKPEFRVILTANSNMAGDDTGNYNTAMIHDKSIPDRVGMTVQVGYPSDEERAILLDTLTSIGADDLLLQYWFEQEGIQVATDQGVKKGSSLSRDDFIHGILQVRDMVRKQSRDCGNQTASALERTMSVRTLQRWVQFCIAFVGAPNQGNSALHYAMERALTNTCTPSTKIAIHAMITSVFGVNAKLG